MAVTLLGWCFLTVTWKVVMVVSADIVVNASVSIVVVAYDV